MNTEDMLKELASLLNSFFYPSKIFRRIKNTIKNRFKKEKNLYFLKF